MSYLFYTVHTRQPSICLSKLPSFIGVGLRIIICIQIDPRQTQGLSAALFLSLVEAVHCLRSVALPTSPSPARAVSSPFPHRPRAAPSLSPSPSPSASASPSRSRTPPLRASPSPEARGTRGRRVAPPRSLRHRCGSGGPAPSAAPSAAASALLHCVAWPALRSRLAPPALRSSAPIELD
ncbi:hypothetical protein PVAP13_1NG354319 [Panicum virgatum]|uniref:Uncharacterized protein n=1 Tax=Panicum virgatum TaxID=38727 RepID=A0A8T0WTD7_PANVG|nr:hypothetical protein PVAP13_1NG354319 [Panicum virgatum]KAG2652412.1 hypothetical protein PVAP13_1NG354319 [Panicum virgatum]